MLPKSRFTAKQGLKRGLYGGSKIRKSAFFSRIIGKSATFAKLAIENENLIHNTVPYKIWIQKFLL